MWLMTAFLFGFLGSFHCATMCGPIAISLPVNSESNKLSKLYYNAGRILTYALLGLIVGVFGKGIAFTGLQKTISIASGLLIIGFGIFPVFMEKKLMLNNKIAEVSILVKSIFKKFIGNKKLYSFFIIGLANGLLPCGFVYLALTAAFAVGSLQGSIIYMAFFGIGTLPMMLSISLSGGFLTFKFQKSFKRLVPYLAAAMGVYLIYRGIYINPQTCCQH